MTHQLKARATLAAVLAVAASLLTACAGTPATPASSSSSSPTAAAVSYTTPRTMPEGKGSTADDGVFPRTVVHFQGETVLSKQPEKVVVISTGQADALLTLGVVPAGSTAGEGADMVPPYLFEAFADKKAELEAITYVGSRFAPDIETVANVKPDLIVMNNAGKDAAALYASLNAIAPTVATQGTGLYWKQDFLLLADALGKRQQAEQWLTTYHADAAAFGAKVTGAPTVSFLRKNGDRMRVFGVASFSGSVAEDSALARPESQRFTDQTSVDISSEQLEKADADWILYGVQGGNETELTGQSLWPTLKAVSAGHAVEVDDDVFYLNVGPTAARGILSSLQKTLG
ncbi:MAG: iron-siderophore ABC transporter substrate-binding protein [Propioniciclava sp.]|uniref:ABC transporter substrate-binding protein n=1 Tax=Propioniciclava sp. TaxID=2038686 RepID=UPI0039E71D49